MQPQSKQTPTSNQPDKGDVKSSDHWSAPDRFAEADGERDLKQEGEAKSQMQRLAQDATQEAGDIAGRVREGAHSAVDQVKQQARSAGDQLKRSASELIGETRQSGVNALNRQKQFASEKINHVGDVINDAASRLSENGDDTLAGYVGSAADGIRQVADYLKDRELAQLINDARGAARRHPAVLYGGLFLAGLGIARFLQASRRRGAGDAQGLQDAADRRVDKQDDARPAGVASSGSISNPNMFTEESSTRDSASFGI